ncbi:TetR/AcrR family transcriptional regulator [Nocardia terpenica]|uniref:TetR family transcriptional regulator n=1 Tax=Nocardia terpenica TaxID=455432 RepID=A0A291RUJ3_9NOCA|nr:TetR/AcrR family transcriptional regulator [Nocardia terpenica]ATL70904.1 TetR family transcriptional regulator [Nocardia terpenica]
MSRTAGRPRGFDRQQALEQALRLFWRHGYEATPISTLVETIGVKPPSLYAAFGDKRALFSAAVQHYQQTYGAFTERALAEEPTAHAALRRLLFDAAADYADPSHPPGCMIITAATNCTPAAEDVRAELRARREATKTAFREKISADIDAGRLPADTDADGLASFYAATVQGMSVQACDGADRAELERIAEHALAAWPVR